MPGFEVILIDAVIGAARAGLSCSANRSAQKPQAENTGEPLHTGEFYPSPPKEEAESPAFPSCAFVSLVVDAFGEPHREPIVTADFGSRKA